MKTDETPHEKRRGMLGNGNPSGDFLNAARCGAKNRRGTSCKCPAMPNGRCRLHGGLSTGPKTPAGIERIRRAVTKHGRFSMHARAEQKQYRKLLQYCRDVLSKCSNQINNSDAKRIGDDFQSLKCDVALSSLNLANVRSVKS